GLGFPFLRYLILFIFLKTNFLLFDLSFHCSRIFNTKGNILMGLGWIFKRKKRQNSTSNTPTSTASPSTRSSSQTQLQELEQVFNKLDVNGDGKISLSELGSIMGSLAQKHQSKEELQKMMKEFNADYGDGFMNFDQFVELNTWQLTSTTRKGWSRRRF
ncbi:hypothetical protein J1N35_029052, partial [Gossypium stocksii]